MFQIHYQIKPEERLGATSHTTQEESAGQRTNGCRPKIHGRTFCLFRSFRSLARFPPQKFANELLHSSTHEIIFPKLVQEIDPITTSPLQGGPGGLDPNVELIYWILLGQFCQNTLYPTPLAFPFFTFPTPNHPHPPRPPSPFAHEILRAARVIFCPPASFPGSDTLKSRNLDMK